jgi:hypothetical protein
MAGAYGASQMGLGDTGQKLSALLAGVGGGAAGYFG